MAKYRHVEGVCRRAARRFGFQEVLTPTFETLELFTAKSGPAIVEELYAFKDKGGRDLTLRPEFTASIVRMYLGEMRSAPKPLKLFTYGPAFRYEEPQKGRYREFWQFNCEILGAPLLEADAELIALATTAVRDVPLEDTETRIGHIGLLREYFKDLPGANQARLLHALDKKDSARLEAELRAAGKVDLKDPLEELVRLKGGRDVIARATDLLGIEGRTWTDYMENLDDLLRRYGVEGYVFDLGVVRGLDYYTGMVFEIDSPRLGAEKQVGGGGSYSLAEVFGGEATPSTGFAMGIDRIVLAAEAGGTEMAGPRLTAYVAAIGEALRPRAVDVVTRLRRGGVDADIDLMGRGPSKNLDHANALGARFVVLVGEREAEQGKVALKDMDTGEQRDVPLDELVEEIRGRPT
jgi:histidyl-tRNA synthetase